MSINDSKIRSFNQREFLQMHRQNFIFILEQSRDSYDYDSRKFLHTYMNRIAVEEDDQNEISSIHEFKDAGFDLKNLISFMMKIMKFWESYAMKNMCMIKTF